jgi:hypothetical protein
MTCKILLLAADADPSWPDKIRQAVLGVVVRAFSNPADAHDEIVDADAAYGTATRIAGASQKAALDLRGARRAAGSAAHGSTTRSSKATLS